MLYVCLCGALPFDHENPVILRQQVDIGEYDIPGFITTESENMFVELLRHDPSNRYGTFTLSPSCI